MAPMPSFEHCAYVAEGTMVDTWARVLVQIGKHVHLSVLVLVVY